MQIFVRHHDLQHYLFRLFQSVSNKIRLIDLLTCHRGGMHIQQCMLQEPVFQGDSLAHTKK